MRKHLDRGISEGFGKRAGALAMAFLLAFEASLATYALAPASAQAAPDDPAGLATSASEGAPKKKRSKYQRSKLTRDESEGVSDRRSLLLTTGEDKTVDVDFDVNSGTNAITIGNPTLLTTTLVKLGEKRQIVFKPLKAGETTVTVRDAEGTIRIIFLARVTGSNLLRVAGEVRSLLRDIEGIDIRIVGPKVIIDGEVLVPADYGRIYMVTTDKTYSDFILNLATLSPLALQVLAKRMQDDINTFAPNVRTRVVNGLIFLEGQVESKVHADRAAKIATLYLPDVKPAGQLDRDPTALRAQPRQLVQNFIVINEPPKKKEVKLVRITVHFVELSKDYTKLFGFKWQPGFTSDPQIAIGQTGAGGAGASGLSASGTISSLIPKLNSLQNSGYARILKTGTVVVKSGEPASLTEQTEIPFAVSGGNGNVASSSAKVGLEVAVTPQILGQTEDISMELKMNQISLVGRNIAGTAPQTASHKVDTRLYVKSGESAAVAGVTSADVGTDFNKDDPNSGGFEQGTSPLFTLLRSKNYHKKKSQFVIFVTPQIIDNASEGTEDLKKNFRVKVK
jgi:pilus assembly protein CpaC